MSLKLSYIIPCYNVSSYLSDCLNSLYTQDFDEWEAICVNDGSTDNTLEILNEYSSKDSRIIIIDKENGGLSDARNTGLKVAKGDYIYFLDSDDYIHPNSIKKAIDEICRIDADFIFFNASVYFETENAKKIQGKLAEYFNRQGNYPDMVTGLEMLESTTSKHFLVPVYLYLYKRSFLFNNNITFYKDLIYEDAPFSFQCHYFAKKVKYFPETIYVRRVREGSITTSSISPQNLWSLYIIIKIFYNYYATNNFSDIVNELIFERIIAYRDKIVYHLCNDNVEGLKEYFLKQNTDYLGFELVVSQVANLQLEINKLKKQLQDSFAKFEELEIKNKELSFQINEKKYEIKKLKKSHTWKIGRLLTFIPRKLKKLLKH